MTFPSSTAAEPCLLLLPRRDFHALMSTFLQPAESLALLVSFLKSGLSERQIINMLSIFSCIGPVGKMCCWLFGAHMLDCLKVWKMRAIPCVTWETLLGAFSRFVLFLSLPCSNLVSATLVYLVFVRLMGTPLSLHLREKTLRSLIFAAQRCPYIQRLSRFQKICLGTKMAFDASFCL